MPIVHVQMLAGRTLERKTRLIAELTRSTSDVLELDPQTVRVILSEVAPEHWGIGGVSVAERHAREGKR